MEVKATGLREKAMAVYISVAISLYPLHFLRASALMLHALKRVIKRNQGHLNLVRS